MVQRPHLPRHHFRRRHEIQPPERRWPVGPQIQAALRQILWHPAQSAFQLRNQIGKAVNRRLETPGVQRQRGVLRVDIEQPLLKDIALIHSAADQMPGDPMPHLAVPQRPDRRVQSRIAR